MPRVYVCSECGKEIDQKKDKYVVVAKKPEKRMHPDCKKKRVDRASRMTQES